ncbi:MAG TPA: DNA methyltransferase [Thermotogota bacterium]|nr:DNA methyltransferase [Thermotogota bacterium]HPJ89157.1 DNA methyltransferase [Thermotogota bacterium]HPR95681.1 DNA methyltransferase [Thermotogota bacterium]
MKEVSDSSVQLIITSPPYWQLKDYGDKRQIGFNQSYEDYINELNMVWQECYRVLENGCRLCVNIGDQFARSVYYGRYKVIPIRTEITRFCETIGFDYMGAVIWQKKTTTNTTGGASIMGSYPYPRNGILSIDYEFILLFKKQGKVKIVGKEEKAASALTKDEWKEYFSGHWNFAGAKQGKHHAMFPIELPHRLIKMFSFKGETVLDPFLGSGTTSLAAKQNERNSIGYEINNDFISVIKDRLGVDKVDLNGTRYDIVKQEVNEGEFEIKRRKLPYLFIDPVNMERKIDPKKMSFGSKVEISDNYERDDFFSVKKVLSASRLILNNGVEVRLIGIKEIEEKKLKAISFLEQKTKNQKVFLRYDTEKYDSENRLMVYLYLKNKTFLNAHLIKANYVEVAENYEYKYKSKFVKLQNEVEYGAL